MDRGERERWNRLSHDAKAVARAMAQFARLGRVPLNDLRMQADLSTMNSRTVMAAWQELESRDYGHVKDGDGPDPVFVMNVAAFQTLAQSRRLPDQAPHRPTGEHTNE